MNTETQAQREVREMWAELNSAVTLADFDQLYVNWIGYSALKDEPAMSMHELRDTLTEYLIEFACEANAS